MAHVPVGFRFHPTDEELINHYLHLKNSTSSAAVVDAVVPEFDLYGETEPWKIFEDHNGADLYDQDLYFFTKLKKVNPHGTRIYRKIGTGTWSEGEPSRSIFVANNPIGRKRKFRYENKSSDHHGCWYMEEYSLDAAADYVICRLRENNRSGAGATGGNRDLLAVAIAGSVESSGGPIPVGFRFHPTDQELICYFLYNKNRGKGGRGLSMMMAEAAEPEPVVTIAAKPEPEPEPVLALPEPEEILTAIPVVEERPKVQLETVAVKETTEPPKDERKSNGDAERPPVVVVVEEEKRVNSIKEKAKGKEKKVEGEMQPPPLMLLEYMKDKEDKDEDDQKLMPPPMDVDMSRASQQSNMFLHEFDLFGSTEPWEIWDMFKGAELCNQDLFFFTQLKKVNPKGQRVGRKVGAGGTWSEGDVSKPIVDDRTGNPIGRKRKLRYEKIGSPHHACWYLDEYSLLDVDIGDYVICRLRKNDKLAAAAFASGEAGSNRKRKANPCTATPATTEAPKQPPVATEGSNQAPPSVEETQAIVTVVEESNQTPAIVEELKQEENASEPKRRHITGLTQVEETAADVLMHMANSALNNNTLKLFGIEIDSTPIIGGE